MRHNGENALIFLKTSQGVHLFYKYIFYYSKVILYIIYRLLCSRWFYWSGPSEIKLGLYVRVTLLISMKPIDYNFPKKIGVKPVDKSWKEVGQKGLTQNWAIIHTLCFINQSRNILTREDESCTVSEKMTRRQRSLWWKNMQLMNVMRSCHDSALLHIFIL